MFKSAGGKQEETIAEWMGGTASVTAGERESEN
jgi:hypothetical protein